MVHQIGRDERQPDVRENEIVIELDRENQYGRTQPRANEPQGNHLRYTEIVYRHFILYQPLLSISKIESPHNMRSRFQQTLLSHGFTFVL